MQVAVDLGHVVSEVHHPVGVAPLVVVPGDHLHELGRELDAGLGVEDGGQLAGDEVLGDDIFVGVAEDALHGAFGSFLHFLADLIVGARLAELDGQINDGDVGGGHAEGHAGELAVEFGDDPADSLGGSGGGRNNVRGSGSAGPPVLASLGRSIDGELVDGHGVNGGHESLVDAPVVVENLGNGSQAVGGARRVGNNGHVRAEAFVVDADNEDGSVVAGWRRDDDLLGTAANVEAGLLFVCEDTGGLGNVVSTCRAPLDLGRVSLVEDTHLLAVNGDSAVDLLDLAVVAPWYNY